MLILLFVLCLPADLGLVGDALPEVGPPKALPYPSENLHHEFLTSPSPTLAKSMLELLPDVCARLHPSLTEPSEESCESSDPEEKDEVADVGRVCHQPVVGDGPCLSRIVFPPAADIPP